MAVMRHEALLIDYAGVLTTDYVEQEYPGELATKFGIPEEDFESFNQNTRAMARLSIGELIEAEVTRVVLGNFKHVAAIQPHEFVTAFYEPDPELLDRLARITDLSLIRLLLCSNIFPASVNYLKSRNIDRYFYDPFLSCEMGDRKRNASNFESVLDSCGLQPT